MLTIRAMSNGKGYASRHLEHSDYYAEGEHNWAAWNRCFRSLSNFE